MVQCGTASMLYCTYKQLGTVESDILLPLSYDILKTMFYNHI